MNSIRKKQGEVFLWLALLFLMILLLKYPQEVQSSAYTAILLCTKVVIPSLFPFFIFSSLFLSTGMADMAGRLFAPITTFLFRLPACASVAFLLGIISGYPVGATVIADLYASGKCSKKTAQRMLSFCNNSGPAFVIGAVGVGIMGSASLGWLLYFVHIFSAVFCGIIMSCFYPQEPVFHIKSSAKYKMPLVEGFVLAVKNSVINLLNICGFIVFFGVIIRLFQTTGISTVFCDFLGGIIPFVDAKTISHLLLGSLEITTGISACAAYGTSVTNLILIEMMISFGGLCVYAQVASVTGQLHLSLNLYVLGKLFTALFSGIFMYIILLASPTLIDAFACSDPTVFYTNPLLLLGVYLAMFAAVGTCIYVPLLLLDHFYKKDETNKEK